jgi:hypothetical protein
MRILERRPQTASFKRFGHVDRGVSDRSALATSACAQRWIRPKRARAQHAIYSCLVRPAPGVDARFLNESLASVSRASSATSFTKNWNYSVPSGVRPLDFRDHIAVRDISSLPHEA